MANIPNTGNDEADLTGFSIVPDDIVEETFQIVQASGQWANSKKRSQLCLFLSWC